MEKYKTVRLGDICLLEKGQQIDTSLLDNSKPYRYINGGIKESGYYDNFNTSGESVLISEGGASCGYINYVNENFWCGCHCYRLHDIKVFPKYLFHALKANQERIMSLRTGSAMPNIQKSIIQKFELKIHDDSKNQQDIASMLDKCNELIEKYERMLDKYDLLIKSRFIEMFGDPIANPMEWDSCKLDELADIVSGITKGRKTKETTLIEVPYMAVSNVKAGYIDWTTLKTIEATKSEIEMYRLKENDVLMAEGGDPDKVGRGALLTHVPDNCIHQNHVFRVRLFDMNPIYFSQYLQHSKSKKYFLSCAKQTTGIASINMTQLKNLPVNVPPIELQNDFASFVQQIDGIKSAVQKSLGKAETLYKSLMQQYFG